MSQRSIYPRFVKPYMDRFAAILGLLVLLPLLACVFVMVRRLLGKPALFTQKRTGQGGRLFYVMKFRSMTTTRDERGELLPDDARLTRFGQFLRASSLDELPQLWNVVRGEMSLVGPRPLLPEYLPRYSEFQMQRHDVRPGITGLAQVSGRNAISWEQKFELDVRYTREVTAAMDAKILLLTILKVLRKSDVSRDGHATSPPFMGTPVRADVSTGEGL